MAGFGEARVRLARQPGRAAGRHPHAFHGHLKFSKHGPLPGNLLFLLSLSSCTGQTDSSCLNVVNEFEIRVEIVRILVMVSCSLHRFAQIISTVSTILESECQQTGAGQGEINRHFK